MQEIAQRFKEEYTKLLSRYKEHLSNAQIMSILQSVTRKQIGIRDNPERCPAFKEVNGLKVPAELLEGSDPELRKLMQGDFKWVNS